MTKKRVMAIFLFTILFWAEKTKAVEVYPIIEDDPIEEIEKREDEIVRKIEKEVNKATERFLKEEGIKLKKAQKNFVYYVDPTYTLERDITYYDTNEKKWKVLYPKGYRFNPVDYIKVLPPPIVIFNPCDESEIKKVKEITGFNQLSYMFISSGCSPVNTEQAVKRAKIEDVMIYRLTKEIKDKLNIQYTISIAEVDKQKRAIKITVISPEKK